MKKSLILLCLIYSFCGCKKQQAGFSPQSEAQTAETKPASLSTLAAGAASIAGVNWADGRDNFQDSWVIPSGLTASDNYSTVQAKTNGILTGFTNNISGVNTIRMPINPPSVSSVWWSAYNGAIDKALSKGFKVILGCWDSSSHNDGKIDDLTAFWTMWQTVVTKYGNNNNIYFEVFNEPYGYSLTDLTSIYAQWLSNYSSVPKGRILLSGTGYSENVTGVGADSRFTSCLLSLHNYAYWANRSEPAWETDWKSRYGSYGSRTVVTEFGATMSSGKDYQNGPQSDNEIAYIVASSNVFRNNSIASVYWPGLRDGDSYSLQTRGGNGNNITLSTVNASGVFRLRYGWGLN